MSQGLMCFCVAHDSASRTEDQMQDRNGASCLPRLLRSADLSCYFGYTVGVTDMPGRSRCSGSCPGSSTILTGTRCTTLTKLPVAFSGGSRLKRAPVAPAMLSTLPLYSVAVGVDGDGGALAGAHVPQLRLLEVRGDPDVVDLHDREQRLAALDHLAGVDPLFRDDAAHRRLHRRVLEVELGLGEGGAHLLRPRLGRRGARLGRGDLRRPGLRRLHLRPRRLLAGLRLRQLALRDADAGFGLGHLRARRVDGGLLGLGGRRRSRRTSAARPRPWRAGRFSRSTSRADLAALASVSRSLACALTRRARAASISFSDAATPLCAWLTPPRAVVTLLAAVVEVIGTLLCAAIALASASASSARALSTATW